MHGAHAAYNNAGQIFSNIYKSLSKFIRTHIRIMPGDDMLDDDEEEEEEEEVEEGEENEMKGGEEKDNQHDKALLSNQDKLDEFTSDGVVTAFDMHEIID